jgi:beta-fructofuranosidase
MTLSLPDKWIWDSWYAHDGQRWHAFFLQADKSLGDPELRHFNVSQGHAISDDLVNWEHQGTCLRPTDHVAWDDYTTWTGSVVCDEDRLWHLFYTGSCREEEGMYQRIGHATSTDLHSWQRVGDGLCLDLQGPNASHYEADWVKGYWHDRAMRDPWVMRDPDGEGWLMYFTARVPGRDEANSAGAIGFATSDDLHNWTLQPPVFDGGYGQLEVPQVFQHQGRWYCLFCTHADHFSAEQANHTPGGPVSGSHYLVGDSPRGPWRIAPGFLDGALPARRYAGRILDTSSGLMIMGFADGGREHFKGYVMNPEPVGLDADGHLFVRYQDQAAE